jgi:hypothetical protein
MDWSLYTALALISFVAGLACLFVSGLDGWQRGTAFVAGALVLGWELFVAEQTSGLWVVPLPLMAIPIAFAGRALLRGRTASDESDGLAGRVTSTPPTDAQDDYEYENQDDYEDQDDDQNEEPPSETKGRAIYIALLPLTLALLGVCAFLGWNTFG